MPMVVQDLLQISHLSKYHYMTFLTFPHLGMHALIDRYLTIEIQLTPDQYPCQTFRGLAVVLVSVPIALLIWEFILLNMIYYTKKWINVTNRAMSQQI